MGDADGSSIKKNGQGPLTSELVFYVNGKKVSERRPNPEWTLLHYLRFKLRLCGTKEACGEGGCGACTVLQSKFDQRTNKIINNAINACLTPLCSVHGTAILTVEGIGSVKKGLHPVQERIAKSHGTQCGFCTPGFVMSMYALLRNNPEPTEEELEDAFQGNLCRCTGYRPILEGYKTLCKKSISPSSEKNAGGCCSGKKKNGGCCMDSNGDTRKEVAETLFDESEFKPYDPKEDIIFPPELQLNKHLTNQFLKFSSPNGEFTWFRPSSLEELLSLKNNYPNGKLVGGNTEIGIETRFKRHEYPILIHLEGVEELMDLKIDNDHMTIGGQVTLTRLKDFCSEWLKQAPRPYGTVQEALRDMLHWFAGQQIRNVATIAGNIVTASPISDLCPIFMATGARLNLSSKDGKRTVIMDETFFPKYRTTILKPHEILTSVEIPLTKENEYVWGAKQARRREDDIAIVNAGMRVVLNPATFQVELASIAFGGMGPTIRLAKRTSNQLISKTKWSDELIEEASQMLYDEIQLEANAPGGMVAYRQVLCQSFLQKFYLKVLLWHQLSNTTSTDLSNLQCAASDITRGKTSAVQLHQIVPTSQKVEDLVGRPVVHLSGLKHATGEAIYADDEVPLQGELYGALVGSPIAHGKIVSIDAGKALALPGVVEFFSSKSISPKQNICGFIMKDEEVFASEYVYSHGQTIGMIVARDPLTAEKAAKDVEMQFEEIRPTLTMEEAMEQKSFHGIRYLKSGDISEGFSKSKDFVEGEMRIGGQEHFYMETQSCIVTPKEDNEVDILIACQGPDIVQRHVALALGIPEHRVRVRTRRMGGAFGGKESKTLLIAIPAALAATKLGRSVRIVMNRWEDMVVTGGRHPFLFRFKVGFTSEGRILGVQGTLASNGGYSWDASPVVMEKALLTIDAAYTIPNWDITGYVCKTNLPSNTAFRGYGGPQASIFMENVMDAVAEKLGKSPVEIREVHLKQPEGDKMPIGINAPHCTVRRCWEECVRDSKYYERLAQVDKFNEENRFKKRGITVMPMKHDIGFHLSLMNQGGALVMIYSDGSVALNHGGTEMGQGLLTKMAQVASRVLEIPMDKIYFSETSTDKVPNATATCGSFTSDLNGPAVMNACQKLVKRLEPFKKANPNGKWEEWVASAYFNRVNLSAVGFFENLQNFDFEKPGDLSAEPFLYSVYGVAVAEVEVDTLTGDHSVLRCDIVIDVGESLNPAVDIGQIEGAFIQGYGLFTMEELLYSPQGLMLTRGPGMYKIPSMGDIPRVFNVSLLRGSADPRCVVYSSKGIGEPPLFLAASVYFAIKEAIKASRKQNKLSSLFRLDSPATAERIRMACGDKIVERTTEVLKNKSDIAGWAIPAV